MSDLEGVGILFSVFGAVLVAYGYAIWRTGNKDILPMRAQISIRGEDDVRRIGKWVVIVGIAVLLPALAAWAFAEFAA